MMAVENRMGKKLGGSFQITWNPGHDIFEGGAYLVDIFSRGKNRQYIQQVILGSGFVKRNLTVAGAGYPKLIPWASAIPLIFIASSVLI